MTAATDPCKPWGAGRVIRDWPAYRITSDGVVWSVDRPVAAKGGGTRQLGPRPLKPDKAGRVTLSTAGRPPARYKVRELHRTYWPELIKTDGYSDAYGTGHAPADWQPSKAMPWSVPMRPQTGKRRAGRPAITIAPRHATKFDNPPRIMLAPVQYWHIEAMMSEQPSGTPWGNPVLWESFNLDSRG